MSAPRIRWSEDTGMVLREAPDGTWMVLDTIGEADPAAVEAADPLRTATETPVTLPVAAAVIVGTVLLGGAGLVVQGVVLGAVGWACWVLPSCDTPTPSNSRATGRSAP